MYKRNCEIKSGVTFPEGMVRIALGVEYRGAPFAGFQKQASAANTVQAALETALSTIADETVTIVCAGRTDAGVNACEQVVHFDTRAVRPQKAWVKGVNTQLPASIRVHWSRTVDSHFHARFSAQARTYRYVIHSSPTRSASLYQLVTWTSHLLDVDAMNRGAKYMLGEHDFSSFRASQCQSQSPVRRIDSIQVSSAGPFIVLQITANAFLHHMVRNIAGTLMAVGRGAKDPSWVAEVLGVKDRCKASPTAAPWGLYFVRAHYDEAFGIPGSIPGPLFLAGLLNEA